MDKYDKAAHSLGKLRRLPIDHPAVIEELNEVQANHLYEMSLGKSSYIECFKGTLGKRLLTGCLLQSLQQLTGVNFIFCKLSKFSGLPNIYPNSIQTTEHSTLRMLVSRTPSLSRSSPTVSTSPLHSLVSTWLSVLDAVTCFLWVPSECACVNTSSPSLELLLVPRILPRRRPRSLSSAFIFSSSLAPGAL